MRLPQMMIAAAAVASAGTLIVPALAQGPNGAGSASAQGPSMNIGRTGRGMMGRAMCGGMMQSLAGGDGRPNSQWQKPRSGRGAAD